MKLNVQVCAVLDVPVASPALLQIEIPTIDQAQKLVDSILTVVPHTEFAPFVDWYGNHSRRGMFEQGEVTVRYSANVEISEGRQSMIHPLEASVIDLPPEVLLYLLPSRYCPSDRLGQFAVAEFGRTEPGYARVQKVCDWINEHITYRYGYSTNATTAFDTATERIGVCRDFAHLGVSICRALGIPARYVSGYCLELEPPDFHAFFQAYLDGRWVSFDATEMQPRPALITVAVGRDAADCAWCTFFGDGSTKSLWVNVSDQTNEQPSI